MNDELKEILRILKSKSKKYEYCLNANISFSDESYEAHLLLNYITNLQQENKEWGMIFDTFSSRPYAHRYLEEKRKELGNKRIIGLDSEMIYKDYYDYKSRCERAIEYINDGYLSDGEMVNILAQKDLLSILQNGSDDNE